MLKRQSGDENETETCQVVRLDSVKLDVNKVNLDIAFLLSRRDYAEPTEARTLKVNLSVCVSLCVVG